MDMQTFAIVQIATSTSESNPIRLIKTIGTLDLKQLSPIKVIRKVQRTLYKDDLFAQLEYQPLDKVLRNYTSNRNETTVYNYDYYI